MNSNKFNDSKNTKLQAEKQPVNNNAGFFQLTKHQLSVNIDKYDSAIAKTTSVFNSSQSVQPFILKKRLNAYDSTMLEDAAYNVLDDTELKLEKRIEKIEATLKDVNEKIVVAETIKDIPALEELNLQREILIRNLENVKLEYQSKNIDTKMTSVLVKIMEFPQKFKIWLKKQFKLVLRRSKLLKNFTPFVRSMAVRDTIGRLDKINKSVDELVSMRVPFGEQEARYETLVNHLSRAGILHSQILKELKG